MSVPCIDDGWLQYTAVNVSKLGLKGGFDAFTNTMSVPDVPASRPQVLYLFPGLQNIDWIPKVDPTPGAGEPFAQMGTDETSRTGNEDSFVACQEECVFRGDNRVRASPSVLPPYPAAVYADY